MPSPYIQYDSWAWGDGDTMEWGDGDTIALTHVISDPDFTQWLLDQKSRTTLLAEMKFGYQSSGVAAEGTVYLADRPYFDDSTNQPYAAIIDASPTFERSIDIEKLGGRGTATLGSVVLANADGA